MSPMIATGDTGVSARVDQVCARIDQVTSALRTLAEVEAARQPLRNPIPPQR